jgi:sugar O-acyltransferase (sialic acid O-acetyltransferase NeuD family)
VRRIRLAIVGAGGFAREVAWLVRDINRAKAQFEFAGYIVSDLSKLGEHDSTGEVRGDYEWLVSRSDVDALAIGIGTPSSRLKVAEDLRALAPRFEWPPLLHPTVRIDREPATIGEGVLLCAGVIATVNVVFEPFSMCNLSCTIGHEAHIGMGTVLNPAVNISGGVVLEKGVLVGTGAQILQYVTVEEGATVGAGAVVNKRVPKGETVVGIPARPLASKAPPAK